MKKKIISTILLLNILISSISGYQTPRQFSLHNEQLTYNNSPLHEFIQLKSTTQQKDTSPVDFYVGCFGEKIFPQFAIEVDSAQDTQQCRQMCARSKNSVSGYSKRLQECICSKPELVNNYITKMKETINKDSLNEVANKFFSVQEQCEGYDTEIDLKVLENSYPQYSLIACAKDDPVLKHSFQETSDSVNSQDCGTQCTLLKYPISFFHSSGCHCANEEILNKLNDDEWVIEQYGCNKEDIQVYYDIKYQPEFYYEGCIKKDVTNQDTKLQSSSIEECQLECADYPLFTYNSQIMACSCHPWEITTKINYDANSLYEPIIRCEQQQDMLPLFYDNLYEDTEIKALPVLLQVQNQEYTKYDIIQDDTKQQIEEQVHDKIDDDINQEIEQIIETEVQDQIQKEVEDQVEQEIGQIMDKDIEQKVEEEVEKEIQKQIDDEIQQKIEEKIQEIIQNDGDVEQQTKDEIKDDIEEEINQKIEDDIQKDVEEEIQFEAEKDIDQKIEDLEDSEYEEDKLIDMDRNEDEEEFDVIKELDKDLDLALEDEELEKDVLKDEKKDINEISDIDKDTIKNHNKAKNFENLQDQDQIEDINDDKNDLNKDIGDEFDQDINGDLLDLKTDDKDGYLVDQDINDIDDELTNKTMDDEVIDQEMDEEIIDQEMDEEIIDKEIDELMNKKIDDEVIDQEMNDQTIDKKMDDEMMNKEMDDNILEKQLNEDLQDDQDLFEVDNLNENDDLVDDKDLDGDRMDDDDIDESLISQEKDEELDLEQDLNQDIDQNLDQDDQEIDTLENEELENKISEADKEIIRNEINKRKAQKEKDQNTSGIIQNIDQKVDEILDKIDDLKSGQSDQQNNIIENEEDLIEKPLKTEDSYEQATTPQEKELTKLNNGPVLIRKSTKATKVFAKIQEDLKERQNILGQFQQFLQIPKSAIVEKVVNNDDSQIVSQQKDGFLKRKY